MNFLFANKRFRYFFYGDKFIRFFFLAAHKQIKGSLSRVHAAARINARPQYVTDKGWGNLFIFYAACLHKRS